MQHVVAIAAFLDTGVLTGEKMSVLSGIAYFQSGGNGQSGLLVVQP